MSRKPSTGPPPSAAPLPETLRPKLKRLHTRTSKSRTKLRGYNEKQALIYSKSIILLSLTIIAVKVFAISA